MDGDGDQAQIGPQHGAALNRARLVLPLFKGKMDALATTAFIAKVESFATVTRLNAEETAQAVAFAMEDGSAADKWIQNLRISQPDALADWDVMRPLLQTRFSPRLTPSEKAAIVESLRQAKEEDVHAFLDRCESVQYLMERDIPDAQKIGANAASYRLNHGNGVLEKFLRGLRTSDGLKQAVNSAPGCDTLEQYKDAAARIEKNAAKATAAAAIVAAVDADISEDMLAPNPDDTAELAALKAGFLKFKKKNWKGKPAGNKQSTGEGKKTPKCWNCGEEGHLKNECTKPKKEGAGQNRRNNNNRRGNGDGGGGSGGNAGNAAQTGQSDRQLLEMMGRQYMQECMGLAPPKQDGGATQQRANPGF